MIKDEILGYLKTIVLTLLVALVLVIVFLGFIQHQVYQEESAKIVQDETIDYQLIGVLIQKNLYLETEYPKDYRYNYKLGILYEIEGDNKKAESEYKTALDKVPFGEYRPYYRLALFYLKQNRLDDAEKLMDSIDDQPDKKLINFKGDIFNKIGDKYYNVGDYENAGLKYQSSLLYYRAIKSDKIKSVENSLASAYVYLADQKVSEMQIDDAITSLQMALSIVNAPILRYKLALLLMDKSPDLAYQYFDEVYKKEPGIINYGTYTAFLFTLSNDAQARGDVMQAALYQFQIRKLKEYFKNNILSVDDIRLESANGRINMNNWTKKYNVQVELTIKNISQHNIDSLFLEVVFKDKNVIIDDYLQQIVDKKSVLRINAESPLITLKTPKTLVNEERGPEEITAEIYALKSPESYKILLKSITIKEKPKRLITNKFILKIESIFRKIASKLPAWLF